MRKGLTNIVQRYSKPTKHLNAFFKLNKKKQYLQKIHLRPSMDMIENAWKEI